jgi:hypothetical protein
MPSWLNPLRSLPFPHRRPPHPAARPSRARLRAEPLEDRVVPFIDFNFAPVASDVSVATNEDAAVSVTMDAFDVDGDALSYTVTNAPDHGTLSGSGATRTYRPAANFSGTDSFTYRVSDGSLSSNIATVTITVRALNDAPTASNRSYSTNEDTAVSVTMAGSDVEGSSLTYTVTGGPAHGTLSGSGATRTYRPAINFNGTDSFTYRVSDGSLNSGTATVTITVNPVNDAPTAFANEVSIYEDRTGPIDMAGFDLEGSPLTYFVQTPPSHGTLTGSGSSRTYTPAANFNGTDSFTYFVNDGSLPSNTATYTITVIPVNDGPTDISLSNSTVAENAAAGTVVGTLSAIDPDVGDTHAFTLTNDAGGRFAIVGNQLVVAGPIDYEATPTLRVNVRATDSGAVWLQKDLFITVLPAPPAPAVTDVRVGFGAPTNWFSLIGNTRDLPWVNIDSVSVVFSQDVVVDADDLRLNGVNVPAYEIVSFFYDAGTHTATWGVHSPQLGADRLTVSLDGDDAGDGSDNDGVHALGGVYLEGGDYSLALDVLPGDFDGDGVVSIQDSVGVRNHMPAYGTYLLLADLNGDGVVNTTDVNAPRARLGSTLPPVTT